MLFSAEMRFRHTPILLLTVLLVAQGVVAGVPHQHGSEQPVDQVVQTSTGVDSMHHCLACAVHVPVVAGAMPSDLVLWVGTTDAEVSSETSSSAFPQFPSSGPRGPPSV